MFIVTSITRGCSWRHMLHTILTQTFGVLDFIWKKVRLHLQELKFVQNLSMAPLLTRTCLLRYSSYEILWKSTVLVKYYKLSKRHIRPYPMLQMPQQELKHNDIDAKAITLKVSWPNIVKHIKEVHNPLHWCSHQSFLVIYQGEW